MLALTDDMFIYVCLSLRMMKAREPIITRAVPKSFVALFRWGVGRSRGPVEALQIPFHYLLIMCYVHVAVHALH